MAGTIAKRIASASLACLLAVATTAQQAVGIVSTVANLVDIVEGRNAMPVQSQQPIVEGATYRATGSSAAEFTFPEGLRAAAGPSSSVAFHPSPAGGGARLVSVSEGLYRFSFPNAGSSLDIATPSGAFRAVSAEPGSELVARVRPDGTVQVAVTKGKVEIRDWRGGVLVLLGSGQSASLGAAAGGTLAMAGAVGSIPADLTAEVAVMAGLLAGTAVAASSGSGGGGASGAGAGTGGAAGDQAATETSGGITTTQALIGAGIFAGVVGGVIAATSGGGGGEGTTATTATTATTTTGQ